MLRRIELRRPLITTTHVLAMCCAVLRILLTLICIRSRHKHMISNLAATLTSACLETEKSRVAVKFYACNPEEHFFHVITGKLCDITSINKASFAHTFSIS